PGGRGRGGGGPLPARRAAHRRGRTPDRPVRTRTGRGGACGAGPEGGRRLGPGSDQWPARRCGLARRTAAGTCRGPAARTGTARGLRSTQTARGGNLSPSSRRGGSTPGHSVRVSYTYHHFGSHGAQLVRAPHHGPRPAQPDRGAHGPDAVRRSGILRPEGCGCTRSHDRGRRELRITELFGLVGHSNETHVIRLLPACSVC